jgi:hypothetical protein
MGFFNYYLSIGLGCFGLAILWHPRAWDWLAGSIILLLALFAHPIGPLWLLATLAYVFIRRKFSGVPGMLIPAAVIAAFAALHMYLSRAESIEVNWLDRPFYLFNGADQLVLYTFKYRWIATATALIFVILLLQECFKWKDARFRKPLIFLTELYLLAFCVNSLLPRDLRFSPDSSWIGLLVPRLTVISAIFALCALSFLSPRVWASLALASCAVFFFLNLYKDTGAINLLESNAELIASHLPYGSHVIPTLQPLPQSRITFIGHVVERACIHHCFVYSNYEPASGKFRVRIHPGSPLATGSPDDSGAMESGDYVVQRSDPPLKNIYQCSARDFTVLCIRDLAVGHTTGCSEDDLPQFDDSSQP